MAPPTLVGVWSMALMLQQHIEYYYFSGYNLTGSGGPSVEALQNRMKECSLAMGRGQDSLSSNEATVHSVATNLSLYLKALRSIIPQKFSSSHRSPCWRSPIILSYQQNDDLRNYMSHETMRMPLYCREIFNQHLYETILSPAIYQKNTSMMCLPAFFLAGFPKSGTTSLFTTLSEHEIMVKGTPKEPHWWTRMPLNNEDPNYLRLAALRYLVYFYHQANSDIKTNPQALTYDASQSTLWDSNFLVDNEDYCAMPIAVSHILPSAKFITVIRNPVERTFSHFLYACTSAHLEPPARDVFHERVVFNVNFFRECLSRNHSIYECANDNQFSKPEPPGCGVVSYHLIISMYYLHLKKWMQFYPRESFLFLRTDEMSSHPFSFMKRITDFLNIDYMSYNATNLLSTGTQNKQSLNTEMLPETRALLSEFFHPFNEMLVELTGDKRFLWGD